MHECVASIVSGTIHAPQRNNSHGWFYVFHRPNLNGRCLTSQQDWSTGGDRCTGDVKIVQRVAGRVIFRNVQCFEVMSLIFNLRTINNGESESSHQFTELAHDLRDRMQMTNPWSLTGQCDIKI